MSPVSDGVIFPSTYPKFLNPSYWINLASVAAGALAVFYASTVVFTYEAE